MNRLWWNKREPVTGRGICCQACKPQLNLWRTCLVKGEIQILYAVLSFLLPSHTVFFFFFFNLLGKGCYPLSLHVHWLLRSSSFKDLRITRQVRKKHMDRLHLPVLIGRWRAQRPDGWGKRKCVRTAGILILIALWLSCSQVGDFQVFLCLGSTGCS